MPKRILVVCQHFWPESFRVTDICDSFIERGFEVEVLCGIPNYPAGQFYDGYGISKNRRQVVGGVKIRRCFEIKRGNNNNIRIFLNYMSFPVSSLFSLPYLLRQKKYDKIFLFQLSPVMMTITGILLGRLRKIETTMYVLDLWPENLYSVLSVKSKLLRAFAFRVCRWHYRKADKLIAITRKLQSVLKERTGKDDGKIAYIPQFCEKIYETPVADEALAARFSGKFNMVFTGNISPAQSFETVISAAKILKNSGYADIAWIIVGDGMSRGWLEDEVKKEGLSDRFTFIGHVPMEAIPGYTHIADGLFACLAKSELLEHAMPAKISAYFATGKPMVLSMDGEVQQIVRASKAGYAVDSGDYEGLADAVLKLYKADEEKRVSMGESAKDYYFKYFERDMNMEKLVDFIFDGENV